ncbi:MAG: hypothetical protein K6F77_06230 [Lachnospiraceae bacterium]|nr:hypothetical protein [Lachnospiraceae bacterium]
MNKTFTVTFNSLPKTLDEMKALPEASLSTPEGTAALFLAAMCLYPENKDEAYKMIDFISGPREVSNMERQFIRDRMMDKEYLPFSYFKGAVPTNNYTPDTPYVLEFSDNPYSYKEENYINLYISSGGADSPRAIKLRHQGSTNKWFLWEQFLLVGIRIPVSEDPWA